MNNFGRPTPIRFPAQHVPMGFRGNKMFPEPHFAQGGVAPVPMPGGSVGPGAPMPMPTFIGHTEPAGILNPHQPVGPIHQPVPGMGPFRRMSPFPLQQFRRGGVASDPFPPSDTRPASGNGPAGDFIVSDPGPRVEVNPPDEAGSSPNGAGYDYFSNYPSVTAPSGSTYYQTAGNQFVNSEGYPRATSVNPADDPYGMSGTPGPIAAVGQAGGEGTGASFNFLMGHQQLKKGGVAAPNLSPRLGDVVPADLTPGEVILNRGEQKKVTPKKGLPPAIVNQLYRARMGR